DRKKVLILGSGPNRIGQGVEFDYCCVQASFALRAAGYETLMVNCNPETVSTDYDTSDRLYFEPLTLEDVVEVARREKPIGAIVCVGDGKEYVIAGVMEHIEEAGIHSGDSACALPPFSLSKEIVAEISRQTVALARHLKVQGLMNVQFAVQGGRIYVLEANPR